jgi:3-oxoacyl-[acyl-carrier protein] reductase
MLQRWRHRVLVANDWGSALWSGQARAGHWRNHGLGLAISQRFVGEGARVVITGRDHALGERAGQALGPGARFFAADAADPDAVASSVRAAADHLGGLDVLVNNAGVGVVRG